MQWAFPGFLFKPRSLSTPLSCNTLTALSNKRSVLTTVMLLLVSILQGCAVNNRLTPIDNLVTSGDGPPKVLLMPMDVELSILTVSGLTEPQAEWTQNAKQHMALAVRELMRSNSAELVDYPDIELTADSLENQLNKLHQAVGASMLLHGYAGQGLPTKKEHVSWTLGSEAKTLKTQYGADYGLFIFVRDSYSSAGRVALQVLAAIGGVGVQGGVQAGYASLVDFETGEIVWFNFLARGTGDLRSQKAAKGSVKALLRKIPGATNENESGSLAGEIIDQAVSGS